MSFRIALSGLNSATRQLDVTAHNIANVETSGFKRSRIEFAELIAAGTSGSSTSALAGVKVADLNQQHTQGLLEFTENNLDLAVSGQGFFTVSGPQGLAYTRAGAFSISRDGSVVNNNLEKLQVFPPSVGDSFALGSLVDLQISTDESPPVATTLSDISLNLQADVSPPTGTFDPAVPATYNSSTSMTVYDSLGGAHTGRLYFAKDGTAANTWNSYFYIDNVAVGTPTPATPTSNVLVFDSAGNLTSPANGQFASQTYTPANGAATIDMTLDYSKSTQFGSDFLVRSVAPNGYESGQISGVEISQSGVVTARYTNRQTVALGQVAMARFANTSGLKAEGDTVWSESFDSGPATLGAAGTGDFGLIQSGALEGSNVDLTAELVDMVSAQRNFQANTQMLSTNIDLNQTLLGALR